MDDMDMAQQLEQEHLERSLAVLNRTHLNGPSAIECISCGDQIPEGRRHAIPGVQKCVNCAD
jgi:phage/conjugal plasmid C-4 type zinc finger TraR family protein